MNVALLLTNAYQIHHYRHLLPWLPSPPAIVVEVRDEDFGVSDALLAAYFPGSTIEWIPRTRLDSLDGRYDVVVCQTPILPMRFLKKTKTIALQYSLAKERYQYGLWRAHVDLNLMYGPYSTAQVEAFCHAAPVGNLIFDALPADVAPPAGGARPTVLLLPTYGDLSAWRSVLDRLVAEDVDVVIKPHHRDAAEVGSQVPSGVRVESPARDPVELLLTADLVVSDFSGAAFDAALCRRPVLLAGHADAAAGDGARLSANDVERSHLAGLAQVWEPEMPFREAAARARALAADDAAYRAYRDRFFVHVGCAGRHAAAAILASQESSRRTHPLGAQIDEALERHVTANRSLRRQRVRSATRATGGGGSASGTLARWRRRAKRLAKRVAGWSPLLARLANRWVAVRRRRRFTARLVGTRPTASANWQGRELVTEIVTALAAEGATVTSSPLVERCLAVLARDARHLGAALSKVAGQSADEVRVAVRRSNGTVRTGALSALERAEAAAAQSLEVRFGTQGPPTVTVRIEVLEWHDRMQRWLARDRSAAHLDWTVDIGDGAGGGSRPEFHARLRETSQQSRDVIARGFAEPIDLVVTWVDSSDPAWRERFAQHTTLDAPVLVSAGNEERFADRDELRFALRSVEAFAPFVRNVFLVTDGQRPSWLASDHPRLRVVDHHEVFPDPSVLPVFNSHAIEACLHRIGGLSEHYLYMNDDVFFGREVGPRDFFTRSGLLRVHLSPSQIVYDGEPPDGAIPTDWASYRVKQVIESEFGYPVRRRLKHVAFGQRRSIAEEIERRYGPLVNATRAARLRSPGDLALPSMMLPHFALATGRAVEAPNVPGEYVYVDSGRLNWYPRAAALLERRPKFFCVNVTRHQEIPLAEQSTNVRALLEALFPRPSSFESPGGGAR